MNKVIAKARWPSLGHLLTHLRTPLYRNSYALVASTGLTSSLGLVYWVLAARLYSAEAMGQNAAVIAAMILLAGLAQLELVSTLTRFIPIAGQATARVVRSVYGVVVSLAAVLVTLFAVVTGFWLPGLHFFDAGPWALPVFGAAVAAWAIYVLQDSVLTGLRQAMWVPLSTGTYGVGKLFLLVAFADHLPEYGIFASWIIPVLFLIVPVNILIFRRLIPSHADDSAHQAEESDVKTLAKFAAGDYFGMLFSSIYSRALPLLVVHQLGSAANAYFFTAWTIASSLQQVAFNVASSFIVETTHNPTRINAYLRHTLVHLARLLLPAIIFLWIGSPFVLLLAGRTFADEGTTLLRLLTLAAVPGSITVVCFALARLMRKTWIVVVVEAVMCVMVLGLSGLWLPANGITGIGFAWLASQTIVSLGAVGLLLFVRRRAVAEGSPWAARLRRRTGE